MSRREIPLVAQLNARWRVVDDPIQWILQRRQGRARAKSTGWQGAHYIVSRTSLRRCIGEYCGEVDPAALAIIDALPERHRQGQNDLTKAGNHEPEQNILAAG